MYEVLILEDDENLNRGISFILQKESYKVYSCFTLREAAEILKICMPQIIICDITLPDGNGLNLIRRIRKNSNAHIICLTAQDQEMDQIMGYEAGADDYITKPFSLSVLVLKIEAYLKKQKLANNDTIKTGDLEVNYKELKILKNGREIPVTKNEWKLLQLFLDHPKQIITKTQLLDKIFDSEQNYVDDNTIAVNIRRLREKLELNTAEPEYIKNVRGIGYLWNKECIRI
jgi:DNA-binding response OmpR family regulator